VEKASSSPAFSIDQEWAVVSGEKTAFAYPTISACRRCDPRRGYARDCSPGRTSQHSGREAKRGAACTCPDPLASLQDPRKVALLSRLNATPVLATLASSR
jgi:hypothetical protein